MKLRFKDGFHEEICRKMPPLKVAYEQKIKIETFEDIGKAISQYYYDNREKLFLEGE